MTTYKQAFNAMQALLKNGYTKWNLLDVAHSCGEWLGNNDGEAYFNEWERRANKHGDKDIRVSASGGKHAGARLRTGTAFVEMAATVPKEDVNVVIARLEERISSLEETIERLRTAF